MKANQSKKPESKPNRKGRKTYGKKPFTDNKTEHNARNAMPKFGDVPEASKIADPRNDPHWYFKSSQQLHDVANFAYAKPLGLPINWYKHISVPAPGGTPSTATSIPGLMSIELAMLPGIGIDAQSPVNLAAQKLYSTVRYDNSGAANYDPPDLMFYILTMDSIYACWNWLKRIYGYARLYDSNNFYLPQAYALADNVDLDDVVLHLSDFRGYLNMATSRITAFRVPATMTYNVRHSWLFANVFTDGTAVKSQQYFFTPAYFHQYDETSSPTGGQLVPIPIHTATKWKYETLVGLLNTLINSAQYSGDIGNMSGDIKKTYGTNLFTLSEIDDNYVVEPSYRREVLSQIENLIPIDASSSQLSQFIIKQDPNTNFIKCQPILSVGEYTRNGSYLNFHWNDVSPEDVIEASRLLWNGVKIGSNEFKLTETGSELCTKVNIILFQEGTAVVQHATGARQSLNMINMPGYTVVQAEPIDKDALAAAFTLMWAWSAFDWAPALILQYNNGSTYGSNVFPPARDWDMYIEVDSDDITSLHLLALNAEFDL